MNTVARRSARSPVRRSGGQEGEHGGAEFLRFLDVGQMRGISAVTLCMLIMRRRAPDAPRGFRTPLAWVVGPIAIAGCLYLLASLPQKTQIWFVIWNLAGLGLYLAYGRRRSLAGQEPLEAASNQTSSPSDRE